MKGSGLSLPRPVSIAARAGLEEFPEEALDELVNGVVEDAFTGEETSLYDRLSDAVYAGLIGATIGATAGGVRGIYDTVTGKTTRATQQAIREIETKLSDRVAADLQAKGSPITAGVVKTILEASEGEGRYQYP